ncbi:DUF4097 family beta strand repeat-containing protein [Nonlabens marinus]|uniref:DUF4097 domain-containing protein n=1 Tax=Nonlabens marinus S1-08 TaxID=1454201 RepID=W8VW66_9FLAO|nr:DUF4097 family beta strand repeat-containing protein [Nonlabens marinus]BAO54482.1 hypothetical protein NMS_0473 [Nonlabens marinus S1-08]
MIFSRGFPNIILLLCISASFCCQAQQKEAVYTYTESQNENFGVVLIDLEHYIELTITTSEQPHSFTTDDVQSGEYSNALVLQTRVANDTLFITDPVSPLFHFPQDKLSAHKVTDSKAKIVLPESHHLFLNLSNANVNLQGLFRSVIVNINTGKVNLEKLKGDTQITSVSADITAKDLENYSFEANSRNGIVTFKNENRRKKYHLKVESIYGDIDLD